MIPRLLDTRSAADALGLTPSCLEAWRVRGCGPRFRKIGRAVRYADVDIAEFLEAGLRGEAPINRSGGSAA